jgi:hypothetical protein
LTFDELPSHGGAIGRVLGHLLVDLSGHGRHVCETAAAAGHGAAAAS